MQSIGLIAAGLNGWESSRDVLVGDKQWRNDTVELAPITELPANERRRVGRLTKLAINVALDALSQSDTEHKDYASVFTSSCGDLNVVDNICSSLTRDDADVSPTQFHNSVHNAQAGYWSISQQNRNASNSICAFTGSFAAGLLEAYTYLKVEQQPVLLVAYDSPGPDLIKQFSPTQKECAVAMLLSMHQTTDTQLEIKLNPAASNHNTALLSQCVSKDLEALRTGCPAARALPLLEGMVRHTEGVVQLPYNDHMNLKVEWIR